MRIHGFLLVAIISVGVNVQAQEVLEVEIADNITMQFTWISSGKFTMGGHPLDAGGWTPDSQIPATPRHEVTISKGFYLGATEVTQEQWYAVMQTAPWRQIVGSDTQYVKDSPKYPAVIISWNEVQDFIEELNERAGAGMYRLPTEAEWEYACRAGTYTRWYFGDSEDDLNSYEWNPKNTWELGEPYLHAVGQKLPNPLGLYDMLGNVWEWVQDIYGEYADTPQVDPTGPATAFLGGVGRVFRGGSFHIGIGGIESACGMRTFMGANNKEADLGFRLVRVDSDPPTETQGDSWGSVKSRIKQ